MTTTRTIAVILPSGRMESQQPSFAVVVPAYNEAVGIGACVRAIHEALERLPNRSALIVVDDGSVDGTAEKLDELARDHQRLVVAHHEHNQGYGAGLRTGTRTADEAGYEYVLFMDSDLTNDPASISAFAAQMAGGVDVIKASRYIRGGGVHGVPLWRSTVSIMGNLVARLLFGLPVRDTTNGFRAVRTKLLTSIELEENGFAVIMEELYRLRPFARSYAEVPIMLTTRVDELRGSSFSFGPRAMAAYLRYPLLTARERLAGRA
jgi:dolichol-phosphate mannosyltransferase